VGTKECLQEFRNSTQSNGDFLVCASLAFIFLCQEWRERGEIVVDINLKALTPTLADFTGRFASAVDDAFEDFVSACASAVLVV
jgi:hypothetical protein